MSAKAGGDSAVSKGRCPDHFSCSGRFPAKLASGDCRNSTCACLGSNSRTVGLIGIEAGTRLHGVGNTGAVGFDVAILVGRNLEVVASTAADGASHSGTIGLSRGTPGSIDRSTVGLSRGNVTELVGRNLQRVVTTAADGASHSGTVGLTRGTISSIERSTVGLSRGNVTELVGRNLQRV